MKRTLVVLLAVGLVMGMLACTTQAKDAVQTQTQKAGTQQVVDAGNKTCPITGNPVNGKDFVTYKGKRYGICCKGCDEEFLKDPEKYIKKLKDKGDLK